MTLWVDPDTGKKLPINVGCIYDFASKALNDYCAGAGRCLRANAKPECDVINARLLQFVQRLTKLLLDVVPETTGDANRAADCYDYMSDAVRTCKSTYSKVYGVKPNYAREILHCLTGDNTLAINGIQIVVPTRDVPDTLCESYATAVCDMIESNPSADDQMFRELREQFIMMNIHPSTQFAEEDLGHVGNLVRLRYIGR